MSVFKELLTALLLKDIYWWQWTGKVKRFLGLVFVLGVVVYGLHRFDASRQALTFHEERLR